MSLFPTTKILPAEDIIGRDVFIRDVTRRTLEHQSVMIPGPRRIGKTAVATEVLRRCREDHGALTASVDLFLQSTPEEFAKNLIAEVLASQDSRVPTLVQESLAALSRWLQGSESELVVRVLNSVEFRWLSRMDRLTGEELVEHALALPQTLADRMHRPVVILLDEFQDVTDVGGTALIKRMRAIWQRQSATAYLFIGSQGSMMRSLFGQSAQALYRFADVLQLPDIPDDAWAPYIVRKFASQNITLDPAVVRELLRHAGGHPYDTMKMCQALYDIARDHNRTHIDANIAWLAQERTTNELAAVFQSELRGWEGTPYARQILMRLARNQTVYPPGVNSGQAKKAVDALMANGVIQRIGHGRYAFYEPMFQRYLMGQA